MESVIHVWCVNQKKLSATANILIYLIMAISVYIRSGIRLSCSLQVIPALCVIYSDTPIHIINPATVFTVVNTKFVPVFGLPLHLFILLLFIGSSVLARHKLPRNGPNVGGQSEAWSPRINPNYFADI